MMAYRRKRRRRAPTQRKRRRRSTQRMTFPPYVPPFYRGQRGGNPLKFLKALKILARAGKGVLSKSLGLLFR